jgi:hypothetical protein
METYIYESGKFYAVVSYPVMNTLISNTFKFGYIRLPALTKSQFLSNSIYIMLIFVLKSFEFYL